MITLHTHTHTQTINAWAIKAKGAEMDARRVYKLAVIRLSADTSIISVMLGTSYIH